MGQFIPTNPPHPAPDVSFTDHAGKTVHLSDFRGRVILVNLWATWCTPCVKEMPALNQLETAMGGKDFQVVLVSQDLSGAQVVDPFFARHELAALTSYLDPKGALAHAFAVRGLPTSILIDRDGNEVGRVEGAAEWDGADSQALLHWYVEKGGKKPNEPVRAAIR